MSKPEPKVYMRPAVGKALIGPAGAWECGDRVDIPGRGSKLGDDGMPGFDGEVYAVDDDGLARVHEYVEPEEEIAA